MGQDLAMTTYPKNYIGNQATDQILFNGRVSTAFFFRTQARPTGRKPMANSLLISRISHFTSSFSKCESEGSAPVWSQDQRWERILISSVLETVRTVIVIYLQCFAPTMTHGVQTKRSEGFGADPKVYCQ